MAAKWTDLKYNCCALIMRHGFDVNISWEKEGYRICCEGIYCATRYPSLEEAKRAAVRFARRILSEALADLPEDK